MNHSRFSILPEPEQLKQQLLTLSALDIILCDTDWLRVYQYDAKWSEQAQLATVSNGAGDNLHIIFAREGVLIKGFDHESPFSPHARDEYSVWPGIYDHVPSALFSYIEQEDALELEDVTFCLWREPGDAEWQTGSIENPAGWDDGFNFLIGYLYQTPEDYAEWAGGYYEAEIKLDVVKQIYAGSRITAELIGRLNPDRNAAEALAELQQLGVPTS